MNANAPRGRSTRFRAPFYRGEKAVVQERVLETGVSPQQIEDALAVCLAFNITDRLANAFDFTVAEPEAMNAGAKHLLKRGYR